MAVSRSGRAFFVELRHAARRGFKQLDVDTDISGDGDKLRIHIFLLEEISCFSIRMAQANAFDRHSKLGKCQRNIDAFAGKVANCF